MDLHSGLPYWIIKNKLFDYFHPLKENITEEVVIIGAGITGALCAHELCKAGISCTIIDKRTISTGSTAASTAQLQYEIDTPLHKLVNQLPEQDAVAAYNASLYAITALENVFKELSLKPGFKRVPTLYLASLKKHIPLLQKEYEIRHKHGLPVSFLTQEELIEQYGVHAPAALYNNESAQLDCYEAATGIINHYLENKQLKVYSHTNIIKHQAKKGGYQLTTEDGYLINCKNVIIAAGFEAENFLPKKFTRLQSTYVIISQPLEPEQIWKKEALIWETQNPYLYARTTVDNRIIIGGEDEPFYSPTRRDKLLKQKMKLLAKRFNRLFPKIPIHTEMGWCGTFGSTKDGLPYIGNYDNKRLFFALGYGGNGITFSMLAAEIIKNQLQHIPDKRARLFSFNR